MRGLTLCRERRSGQCSISDPRMQMLEMPARQPAEIWGVTEDISHRRAPLLFAPLQDEERLGRGREGRRGEDKGFTHRALLYELISEL